MIARKRKRISRNIEVGNKEVGRGIEVDKRIRIGIGQDPGRSIRIISLKISIEILKEKEKEIVVLRKI